MNPNLSKHSHCQIVDEEVQLTLPELCQSCHVSEEVVVAWVFEGVLEPLGPQSQEWRFGGTSLRRARLAQQLTQELDLNTPGVALALDLLEQIEMLKAQLVRSSHY